MVDGPSYCVSSVLCFGDRALCVVDGVCLLLVRVQGVGFVCVVHRWPCRVGVCCVWRLALCVLCCVCGVSCIACCMLGRGNCVSRIVCCILFSVFCIIYSVL